MGTSAYIVPQITPDQFAQRMAALYPAGWASNDGKTPGGIAYGIMKSLAIDMTFELDTSLTYADAAISVLTAQDGALDLAGLDFFGTDIYAQPRFPGQSDSSYSAALEKAMFREGATRKAVADFLTSVVGPNNFRIIEPWSPADNGVIDGGAGAGMMFLDVDTRETPGLISDPSLAYQGFIQAILPYVQPLGPNPMPCMDNAVGTIFGGCVYLDVAGSSMFDFYNSVLIGAKEVYRAIECSKCEGTIAWMQFVSSIS